MAADVGGGFDPTTAKPVEGGGGFDPSTAKAAPQGPKVDYDTGLSFTDKMALAQADNDEEKQAYLTSVYGSKNVEKQKDGTLTVNVKGQKIAANGGSWVSRKSADFLANSPTLLGMGAGAEAGAAVGSVIPGWGTAVGAVGGAIVGGMTGKAVVEGEKAMTGRYHKTLKQYGEVMLETGKDSAEGEVGGRILGGVADRLVKGKIPELLSQTNAESQEITKRMLAGGARPQAQASMPGMKHFAWMESLARKVVGPVKSQDAANAKYVRTRMAKALYDSGHQPAEIEATLKAIEDGQSKIPTAQLGEKVTEAVQAHQKMLTANVEDRLKTVNTELDRRLERITKLTDSKNPEELANEGAAAITSARKDFGTAMDKAYNKVDQMVGDRKLVPIQFFSREAKRITGKLFKTGQQPMAKEAAGLADQSETFTGAQLFGELGMKPPPVVNGKIAFADAQRIRTMLLEKAGQGPIKGMTEGEMTHLAGMMDHAIDAAAANPSARPAVNLLRQTNGLYKKGIAKFEDSTIKWMVSSMRAGIPANPEAVASRILKGGNNARIATVKQLVGPETWKKVVGSDWKNFVTEATDETGAVSGVKMLRQLADRKGIMDQVYGPKFTKEITELSQAIAMRDGHLPFDSFNASYLKDTLGALKKEQGELDTWMQKQASSGFKTAMEHPERVFPWLAHPDHGTALKGFIKTFGEDSEAVKGVRQAALKDVLSATKMEVASKINAPDALTKAIARYTPEQQQLLFPHGLADDIKLLGKETDLLMRDLTDESKASFAAGALLGISKLTTRIPLQISVGVYQVLLSQPSLIKYLAVGLRHPGSNRGARSAAYRTAKSTLKTLVRYGYLPNNLPAPQPQDEEDDE